MMAPVGRRIFFTVSRRVIVDEAFDRAKKLAEQARSTPKRTTGILGDVALRARLINQEQGQVRGPAVRH